MSIPNPFTVFFTCDDCGLIAQPTSADYVITATREPDWSTPPLVRCSMCGHQQRITLLDIVRADTDHTCTRCDAVTACPAVAAEVSCSKCGLIDKGPGYSDKARMTSGLHAVEIRAAWLHASGRTGDES